MRKYFFVMACMLFVSACTVIKNGKKNACDYKYIILNTGIDFLASAPLALHGDNQADSKWAFCIKPPNPAGSYNPCDNASAALVKTSNLPGHSILDYPQAATLQITNFAPYPNSGWIVVNKDFGNSIQNEHATHNFTVTFCLQAQDLATLEDFELHIQSLDADLGTYYINGSQYINLNMPPLGYVFEDHITIHKSDLHTGLNYIEIITSKSTSMPFSQRVQNTTYSALNVMGYIKIKTCCNN